MSHAQPQRCQYNMPCVKETSVWMFIPNVVHAFVDCLCKWVRWNLDVKVILFPTISSVIDWIEANWHGFCAWCPWKAIPVQVWCSFFYLMLIGALGKYDVLSSCSVCNAPPSSFHVHFTMPILAGWFSLPPIVATKPAVVALKLTNISLLSQMWVFS